MSRYPLELVRPMIEELTALGFEELKTPEAVDAALRQPGTVFAVINSVCGCAAGAARPAVALALQQARCKPDVLVTTFAGVDLDATRRLREYTLPYPPSSPSMALFKDGQLVHFIERHHIEGYTAEEVAEKLRALFEEHCGSAAS